MQALHGFLAASTFSTALMKVLVAQGLWGGAAKPQCSASISMQALRRLCAALHVQNRRCVASLQRSTFQAAVAKMLVAQELWSGAAKPLCSA